MSQADLAEKMAALGWKYHPQTVHRIESGQRKITIGEASALAGILRTSLSELTWPDLVKNTVAWFDLFINRADEAYQEIALATRDLVFARGLLERGIADVQDQEIDSGDVREAVEEAQARLANATPEKAVEAGRDNYAEWAIDGHVSETLTFRGERFIPRAPWEEEPDGEG